MITIEDEARIQSKYPFDIDNFSERYKTKNNLFKFTSPSLWVIEKNLFFLLKNSKIENFDIKYRYKPSYLSYDKYKVTNLDFLLMRVNNIACAEDFDLNTIIIPSMSAIIEICRDKYSNSTTDEVEW